jgi:hypothetical protein
MLAEPLQQLLHLRVSTPLVCCCKLYSQPSLMFFARRSRDDARTRQPQSRPNRDHCSRCFWSPVL